MSDGRLALVTGGAGFIGSHVVDALLAQGWSVRVLDDLSTGSPANLDGSPAELVEGDVADEVLVPKVLDGASLVVHLAASRAVARSVDDPLGTDRTNARGTLVVLDAARRAGVPRVVAASSSSVYGGAAPVPTPESAPMAPRSPYAVSKVVGELYGRVYAELYGLDVVLLRYFNVYGPRQSPDSAYAAVIPLFAAALLRGEPPVVHGDGLQSRDFTFVDDAVAATLAAARAPSASCAGRSYNVAGGRTVTLLELLDVLRRLTGATTEAVHVDPRPGDVALSGADLSAAAADLGYRPAVGLDDGLSRTLAWLTEARS